jgi:hypothetical protein
VSAGESVGGTEVTDQPWAAPGSGTPPSGPAAAPPPVAPPEPEPEAEPETEIPLRPLGVSEILDGAITYIRRNPRATLGMSAVMTTVVEVVVTLAQYLLIGARARTGLAPGTVQRSVGWAFVIGFADLLLTAYVVLLLSGLLAPVMARTLMGRRTPLGHAWRDVRPRLGRLVGAASAVILLVVLAVAVPFAPLLAAVLAGAPDGVQALAWVFGVPVAFLAMVSAYVWFAFAPPILVMERRGAVAALRRSAEIVRRRWWRTFGVLFLALLITLLAEFVVIPAPFTVITQIVVSSDSDPRGWLLVALLALNALARIVAGTLANPFNAGVIAITYADRRMRREAFDLELQIDPPEDPMAAWLPGPLTAAGAGPQPEIPRHAVQWTTAPPSGGSR